jgi:multidrug efflux pump subunit AcrA (membrane-fusion protein)
MSANRARPELETRDTGELIPITRQTPALLSRSHATRVLSREQPKGSGKPWVALSLAAIVAAAAVAFYHPWQAISASPVAAEAPAADALRTVSIARPAPVGGANVVLPATLRPWQTTTLHARVSGYLTAWHYDLGAQVKAGELLAEIETPELDQELAEGEALAREADAAAAQAEAERTEAQAELHVAEAQQARVQAEYDLAKSQLVRREKLIQRGAISQEEYDTFQRQVEARRADVAAAQSDVARRRTNLQTRAAVIQARQAAATSRQANVDRLKELQGFKRIVAPFDGVITGRTAEVGMLVTAGQEPLFVVEDFSRIRVQVEVPQTYAMQTGVGVAATVSLPESNVPPVAATITRIADSIDAATRTMLAEIELDNGERHLQSGSYAQVTLAAASSGGAWTIPTNTVAMRTDGPHVALVDGDSRIEIRRVELGRDLGNRVVVTQGIRGSERLVVNPSDNLASGLRVQVVEKTQDAQHVAQR